MYKKSGIVTLITYTKKGIRNTVKSKFYLKKKDLYHITKNGCVAIFKRVIFLFK